MSIKQITQIAVVVFLNRPRDFRLFSGNNVLTGE